MENDSLEQKIGQIISLKFSYKGQELLDRAEAYFEKNMKYSDEEIIKALESYKSNPKYEYANKDGIYSTVRLYENLPIKNCILGASSYPFEINLNECPRIRNMYQNYGPPIDYSSPDFFDQQYVVYQKYKYLDVFYLDRFDPSLHEAICTKHPFFALRDKIFKNTNIMSFKEYRLDISDFVSKEDIENYFKKPYKPSVQDTDIKRYFYIIDYIDSDYFLKIQGFKNDPLFAVKSHEPYFCKDCVPLGYLLDLGEMDDENSRRNYLKEWGPYFPKDFEKEMSIREEEFLVHIKGKNPHYL